MFSSHVFALVLAVSPLVVPVPAAGDGGTMALKKGITELVDQRYGGDWDRAFTHFGGTSTADELSQAEANKVLKAAQIKAVGEAFTIWDEDANGQISFAEFDVRDL